MKPQSGGDGGSDVDAAGRSTPRATTRCRAGIRSRTGTQRQNDVARAGPRRLGRAVDTTRGGQYCPSDDRLERDYTPTPAGGSSPPHWPHRSSCSSRRPLATRLVDAILAIPIPDHAVVRGQPPHRTDTAAMLAHKSAQHRRRHHHLATRNAGDAVLADDTASVVPSPPPIHPVPKPIPASPRRATNPARTRTCTRSSGRVCRAGTPGAPCSHCTFGAPATPHPADRRAPAAPDARRRGS